MTSSTSDPLRVRSAARALRVPEITVYFWVIKGLSTALGESTSDYLVHAMAPELAVVLGFIGFAAALALQFSMRRYRAGSYWLAVVMVGIFGTMAADVLHVGFHVPYALSAVLYSIVLAAIFITWQRTEHTLSVHSIDTARREAFYWAAVVSTFALGTAIGDLTAITFKLGYLGLRGAVRRADRGSGHRVLAVQAEPDPRLLVGLRPHPSARSLHRRLDGQTGRLRRPGVGRRPGERGDRADHRRPGRLPGHQWRRHPGADRGLRMPVDPLERTTFGEEGFDDVDTDQGDGVDQGGGDDEYIPGMDTLNSDGGMLGNLAYMDLAADAAANGWDQATEAKVRNLADQLQRMPTADEIAKVLDE